MWDIFGAMADFYDLHDYTRRYPELLTLDEIGKLDQRDFTRYCRENLWERIAKKKFNKPFNELTQFEKNDVDFDAIMQIMVAHEKVRKEDEQN